jgi:hypothetical protein
MPSPCLDSTSRIRFRTVQGFAGPPSAVVLEPAGVASDFSRGGRLSSRGAIVRATASKKASYPNALLPEMPEGQGEPVLPLAFGAL